ncbi:MAG: crosslink repair DNA glycosylase YcaQ family protein [Verrucomicrobiota bacterium]
MNSPAPLRLNLPEARLFHRRAVRLSRPFPETGAALEHHGFIQIDPINVCGRMHDLILRNRVADYREGGLMRLLHGPADSPLAAESRTAFEHHLPHSHVLAAMPLNAWPYLLAAMRNRTLGTGAWSGGLEPRQAALAEVILREIAERGALSSEDLADGQRDDHGWGSQASLAKTTLHKLFFHGRLLIARRQANRRYYDLPERVLPAAVMALPEPTPEETARWITLLKLRQRRVMTLSPAERARVADLVQSLAVEGIPGLHCLRSDLPLLDEPAAPLREEESRPLLLAPLDPLIYDRRLASRLWGFDYTWEVYTPPEKRLRGYYALPLLSGLEIAGHIDPKADRAAGLLRVINRSVRRGHTAAPALKSLASFLGLK